MQKTESKEISPAEDGAIQKGVALKLLGVVAIILGCLDSMLSWRGGFALEPFYIALLLGGVILYVAGSLAGKR